MSLARKRVRSAVRSADRRVSAGWARCRRRRALDRGPAREGEARAVVRRGLESAVVVRRWREAGEVARGSWVRRAWWRVRSARRVGSGVGGWEERSWRAAVRAAVVMASLWRRDCATIWGVRCRCPAVRGRIAVRSSSVRLKRLSCRFRASRKSSGMSSILGVSLAGWLET